MPPQASAPAPPQEHSAIRRFLLARGNSAIADRVFRVLMVLCALSIFVHRGPHRLRAGFPGSALLGTIRTSNSSTRRLSTRILISPNTGIRSTATSAPCSFRLRHAGFLVSLALLLAVPLAVGVAIFLTEMCPRHLARPTRLSSPSCWPPFPASSMACGPSSSSCHLLRHYVNPCLDQTVLGLDRPLSTTTNPTGSAISPPASFSPS
jgi:phosphate transport system permease protein